MEITNEIITKVRAMYLGSPFKMLINSGEYKTELLTVGMLTLFNIEDKLLLKPLSQISDEDEMELCNIIGTFDVTFFIRSLIQKTVYSVNAATGFQSFQFLQSRGYDLPNYLLGGKTLHEAGLAIYEPCQPTGYSITDVRRLVRNSNQFNTKI